jgi:hypothetical protein
MRKAMTRGVALVVASAIVLSGCGSKKAATVDTSHAKTLWRCPTGEFAKAVTDFLNTARSRTQRHFVTLAWGDDGVPFIASVPAGWFSLHGYPGHIVLDEAGFRIIISVEPDPQKDWEPPLMVFLLDTRGRCRPGTTERRRRIMCYRMKGDTNYEEKRFFTKSRKTLPTECFAVRLHVSDSPFSKKTVGDLVAHLEKHYDKFEGLCAAVGEHVSPE